MLLSPSAAGEPLRSSDLTRVSAVGWRTIFFRKGKHARGGANTAKHHQTPLVSADRATQVKWSGCRFSAGEESRAKTVLFQNVAQTPGGGPQHAPPLTEHTLFLPCVTATSSTSVLNCVSFDDSEMSASPEHLAQKEGRVDDSHTLILLQGDQVLAVISHKKVRVAFDAQARTGLSFGSLATAKTSKVPATTCALARNPSMPPQ